MLKEITTDEARLVGLVLLKEQLKGKLEENTSPEAHALMEELKKAELSPDVLETADALRSWSEKARYVTQSRSTSVR
jgi:hypothetical protein